MVKLAILVAIFPFAFPQHAHPSDPPVPLALVQTIEVPNIPEGHRIDHLGIDLNGHRLFSTMQEAHKVAVIDLDTGTVTHSIPVANPHAVLYRRDLDRIYVSDDDPVEPGVKIFDGRDYRLLTSVKLLKRTDSMVYDPQTHYLYVVNGGTSAKLDYSLVSILDSTTGSHLGDVKVSAGSLEDMDLEASGYRLYVAVEDKNQVAIIDREKRIVLDAWSVPHGSPVATAVDEAHHRLFVACRIGQLHGEIAVFDTQSGKAIKTLPIGGLLDYMVFDAKSRRIYAVCSTADVDVYEQHDDGEYALLGKVETALLARTGLLVPELHRFFVASPNTGLTPAEILVFQVEGLQAHN
ncbi:MAG: YncE family protein [Candidatus Sulfotelmatobacter sp.]|jgi:DNA-binding beta-propeller fold protein YncE